MTKSRFLKLFRDMKYDHREIIRPVIYGGLQEYPDMTELVPVYEEFWMSITARRTVNGPMRESPTKIPEEPPTKLCNAVLLLPQTEQPPVAG